MCHAQMVGAAMKISTPGDRTCSNCGRTIPAGEKLTRGTCKQAGEVHFVYICSDCPYPSALSRWLRKLKDLL